MQVRLVSHEGEEFCFPLDLRKLSGFVAGLDSEEPVDLCALEVTSWALCELKRFGEHHLYEGYEPLTGKKWPEEVTDMWDCSFLSDLDSDRLLELMTAAQRLVVTPLYKLAARYLAWKLSEESLEELSEELEQPTELSEAERLRLQCEFPWFSHTAGGLAPSGQSTLGR